MRGYSCIGLDNLKTTINIGSVRYIRLNIEMVKIKGDDYEENTYR